jgi:transcriptional regulator with XRE-family HTH domain
MRLNEAVRLYCSVNKIGVRKLAKETGLDKCTVSRFLSGKTADGISIKHAFKIFNWLMEEK